MEQTTRTRQDVENRPTASWGFDYLIYDGDEAEPFRVVQNTRHSGVKELGFTTRSMTDVVTRDFKKLVRSGVIVNNPLSSTRVEELNSPPETHEQWAYTLNSNGGYSGYKMIGTSMMGDALLGDYLSTSLTESQKTTAQELAITAAFASASASDVLLLATIGESRETYRMFVDIFKKVIGIRKAVRRLDLKYAKKLISLEVYKEKYLMYRYGLRPLVFEAHNLLAALNQAPRAPRMTFRATRNVTRSDTDEITLYPGSLTVQVERSCYVDYTVRAGILAHVEHTPVSIWGLGQWMDSAWELTPFSFIFDWFFNVGKLFASWTPKSGVTTQASWLVMTETTAQNNTLVGVSINEAATNLGVNRKGAKSRITIVRSRVPNIRPVLLPHFDVKLDTAKILDLLAIFRR